MVGLNGHHGPAGALNGKEMHPAAAYLADAGAPAMDSAGSEQAGDTSTDASIDTGIDGAALHRDDELRREQQRLEAELAVAQQRVAAANARAAAHDEAVRAGLRAELLAAQQTLAEMEDRHEATIARLRAYTQLEVDRILAAARHQPGAASQAAGEEVHHG